jgi:hypothetical protein
MSSIGLNNNTYRLTGKYLDLLNDIVVKLKIDQEVDESKKEQLIEFIGKLRDENNFQPQFQLLSNIVERELRPTTKEPSVYLNTFITEIRENNMRNFLPKIEFLAGVLDTENSEALAKIIGE